MNNELKIEVVDRCILCGATSPREDSRFYRLLGLKVPYGVVKCRECALRWLSPRPTADRYRELYRYENYFDGERAVERYASLACARRPYFAQRIQCVERLFTGPGKLKLLDVGAATGEFVVEATRRGHDANGIELSEGAREAAYSFYGIHLHGGELSDYAPCTFDVIHMNHVLEHMPDPSRTLRECYHLLRQGGVLIIEVPQQFDNVLECIQYAFGLKRPAFNLYSLHHTYFFRAHHVRVLLDQAGFRTLRLATANLAYTPLWPFSLKNASLAALLYLSDVLSSSGNIIEAYACKAEDLGKDTGDDCLCRINGKSQENTCATPQHARGNLPLNAYHR
jgi:2-polyprenyl-3-methyl-5-hydroxy-6-metoxy-1,4-benzoquinol methylase